MMKNIFRLINKTGSSKSWGAQDVVNEFQKDIDGGKVMSGSRVMIVYVDPPNSGSFDTHFIQCGMSASEMIMMLDIAKMDIYNSQMRK